MSHQKVSVVIPTIARESLVDVIDSILNSHYPVEEILVICDGMDALKKTRLLMSRIRVGVVPKITKMTKLPRFSVVLGNGTGVGAMINTGLTLVKGNIVALAADDDIWLPDKLTHQLQAYSRNEVVFTSAKYTYNNFFSSVRPSILLRREDQVFSFLYSKPVISLKNPKYLPFSSVIFPLRAAKVMFPENLKSFEDIIWLANLQKAGFEIIQIKHVGVTVQGNLARSHVRQLESSIELAKKISDISTYTASMFLRYHAVRAFIYSGKTCEIKRLWKEAEFYSNKDIKDRRRFAFIIAMSSTVQITLRISEYFRFLSRNLIRKILPRSSAR
jgi:hypothetical protein